LNKKEYRKDLIKRKGLAWVESHEGLLDAQYEYIETLGEPEDVEETDSDFEISDGSL